MDPYTPHTEHWTEQFGGKHAGLALLAVLILLALFLASKIVTEVQEWRYIGSGQNASNTISVQGEGEVFAIPDIATFTFSVIKEGTTATEAQDAATAVANEAIEYLKGQGVEEKDIQTTNYSVYPRYEYPQIQCVTYPCPQGERRLVGFEINQGMSVKVRNTAKAGELLSGIGNLGVEQISGVLFTTDDKDALVREARQKAIQDAREKAARLADDLDVRLVRIVNFNESGAPIYYSRETLDAAVGGMGGDGKSTPNIPVGENRITSQVHIIYEIQ